MGAPCLLCLNLLTTSTQLTLYRHCTYLGVLDELKIVYVLNMKLFQISFVLLYVAEDSHIIKK